MFRSRHVKKHLPGWKDDWRYKCDAPGCEFKTKNPKGLKRHKYKHSKVQTLNCRWPECKETFNRMDNGRRHVVTVHDVDKDIADMYILPIGPIAGSDSQDYEPDQSESHHFGAQVVHQAETRDVGQNTTQTYEERSHYIFGANGTAAHGESGNPLYEHSYGYSSEWNDAQTDMHIDVEGNRQTPNQDSQSAFGQCG